MGIVIYSMGGSQGDGTTTTGTSVISVKTSGITNTQMSDVELSKITYTDFVVGFPFITTGFVNQASMLISAFPYPITTTQTILNLNGITELYGTDTWQYKTLVFKAIFDNGGSVSTAWSSAVGFIQPPDVNPIEAAFIMYAPGGYFDLKTVKSSTVTQTNMAGSDPTHWHTYKIYRQDSGHVLSYIDETLKATNTTNISTANISITLYNSCATNSQSCRLTTFIPSFSVT